MGLSRICSDRRRETAEPKIMKLFDSHNKAEAEGEGTCDGLDFELGVADM
jgi:hypothetical protein